MKKITFDKELLEIFLNECLDDTRSFDCEFYSYNIDENNKLCFGEVSKEPEFTIQGEIMEDKSVFWDEEFLQRLKSLSKTKRGFSILFFEILIKGFSTHIRSPEQLEQVQALLEDLKKEIDV